VWNFSNTVFAELLLKKYLPAKKNLRAKRNPLLRKRRGL
jgi:hypothetical protein